MDAARPDAARDASVQDAAADALADAALEDASLDAAFDAGTPPPILISELRTRGPAGGNDEFVEIVNASDHAIDIGGFKLRVASATGSVNTRAIVPAGVVLAPGATFLFANAGASGYSGTAPPDATYTFGLGDACGVAIADAAGNVLDAFATVSGSPFVEGNARTPLTESVDQSHARRTSGDMQIDTGDNASDFATAMPSTPRSQKGDLPGSP